MTSSKPAISFHVIYIHTHACTNVRWTVYPLKHFKFVDAGRHLHAERVNEVSCNTHLVFWELHILHPDLPHQLLRLEGSMKFTLSDGTTRLWLSRRSLVLQGGIPTAGTPSLAVTPVSGPPPSASWWGLWHPPSTWWWSRWPLRIWWDEREGRWPHSCPTDGRCSRPEPPSEPSWDVRLQTRTPWEHHQTPSPTPSRLYGVRVLTQRGTALWMIRLHVRRSPVLSVVIDIRSSHSS